MNRRANCRLSEQEFTIFPEDLAFYDKMQVPEPTVSPFWRMLRRLSYRNERYLYHRKCSLSGRPILSTFSEEKPFPVYDLEQWWGDNWNAQYFGRQFDFSRPFFEQFFELRNSVPRLALQQQKPMENSLYCNCASHCKNCYLVFSASQNEDCYYGSWVNQSRNCIDNYSIIDCELCYECVACRNCYNLRYSQDCTDCSDSFFLKDCTSCKNCFASQNLYRREYVVFNEQKSREEYQKFISTINQGSFSEMEALRCKAEALQKKSIVRATHNVHCEDCTGDYIRNCSRLFESFQCVDAQDVRYSQCLKKSKFSMDFTHWGSGAELVYECQACGNDVYNLRFCNLCWSSCSNLTYCDQCFSCHDCFACVGLKNAKYCIFNIQYNESEYKKLMQRIIDHMKESGEWGEFFPPSQSIYAYNESLAYEEYPLTEKEIRALNWQYKTPKQESGGANSATVVPDSISEVAQNICEKILYCTKSGKPFRITSAEFSFYCKQKIPLPRLCPDERHGRRFQLRNPRRLWSRECDKTGDLILTSYAPGRPERVYSEEAYVKFIGG